jgi:hypothetical protein
LSWSSFASTSPQAAAAATSSTGTPQELRQLGQAFAGAQRIRRVGQLDVQGPVVRQRRTAVVGTGDGLLQGVDLGHGVGVGALGRKVLGQRTARLLVRLAFRAEFLLRGLLLRLGVVECGASSPATGPGVLRVVGVQAAQRIREGDLVPGRGRCRHLCVQTPQLVRGHQPGLLGGVQDLLAHRGVLVHRGQIVALLEERLAEAGVRQLEVGVAP